MSRLLRFPSLSLFVLCVAFLRVSEAQEDCVAGQNDCFCSGRLRLENNSGIIVDHFGGGNYMNRRQCLFYLESDRPMSSVRLRFHRFDLECLWDYLYVFSGDSIHSAKIAALTGNLLLSEPESEPVNETNSTNSSGSGMGMGTREVLVPFREPHDITIVSPSSSLLLYFFTDSAAVKTGFNVSYWVNYMCPEDCLGRGNCSEDGRCECVEGWRGQWCQVPACPNKCFDNGVCSGDGCQCEDDFTGVDCSVPRSSPHWESVNYTTTGSLTEALLARAAHSAVLWDDCVIVYGGYRFPSVVDNDGGQGGSGSGSGENGESGESGEKEEDTAKKEVTGPQLLHYHLSSGMWEELEVNRSAPYPSPRYGHSAVLYNDVMHIFGGVLIPEERITNEHWALHLPSLTWSPLTLHTDDVITNLSDNSTTVDADADVTMETTNQSTTTVPIRVRDHTAHVVGSMMVVLFGMTDSEHKFIYYVQEYDFQSGEWSVPSQNGMTPGGRMGHSSVYDEQTGLVYVYGGHAHNAVSQELLIYDPLTHSWSRRNSGPAKAYFHSSVLLWDSLLLVFGGSGNECFSDQLLVYNMACDEWVEGLGLGLMDYLGLPGDARRIGHTAFLDSSQNNMVVFGGFLGQPFGDMLQLVTGDCSVHSSEEECTNGTVFCGWTPATNSCVSLAATQNNSIPPCSVDQCVLLSSCDDCMSGVNCTWSDVDNACHTGDPNNATCTTQTPSTTNSTGASDCVRFSDSCQGCLGHGCQWAGVTGGCVAAGLNVTVQECLTPCSSLSCSECRSDKQCLWCSSLNQCLSGFSTHSYTYTYPFGQCLGYSISCPERCESYLTCDRCYERPECGWCRDPVDTGLGVCSEGGFLSPLESSSSCPAPDWFFEQCPACQCNGHSTCVNESVCEECQNNTSGLHCELCALGYFGIAEGGGTCTECDCNGYDSECDNKTGVCTCYDVGVLGPNCSVCNTNSSYEGDADNFCFYKMSVGFVYTFGVTDLTEKESFYLAVPSDDTSLKFEFDIDNNPHNREVLVQLFLGKVSENFWILANLTDPIKVYGGGKFSRDLDDRSGNRNSTVPRLFSFTHPRLRSTSNFTDLFYSRTEHDYTSRMWNGDVALIVHVYNLTESITYKMTLDQTNLWFLLYFFATFIICFTGLLSVFLIGWYLKKKIEMRRYMRQQYRDLRRRVARPFSRIKLIVQRRLPGEKLPVQNASYLSAQTCKSGKAGILTTFIQLPGESSSGRPSPGRTGLCLGTTLVKVSKRTTRDRSGKRKERGEGREEVVGLQSAGERNGSLRERRVDQGEDAGIHPSETRNQSSTVVTACL